ncbi:Magnesium transporter MgtE [Symmachiella dynata]|uniref:Magnesium transporter MgtE n=1 Tax=Symmachiella dynata TaxID=2527995 RepID=A0A517ZIA3_9PLAN|nr:magnesium transporter [Symmachiella dynata]QDU42201.1 Magnesium transporter MgtE [Symmachiella dynata]
MYNPLLLPEVREMLDSGDDAGLIEFCTALHPGVVAEVIEGLSNDDIWNVLSHCDVNSRVQIFTFFDLPKQEDLVTTTDRKRVSALLEEMAPDDRVDLLERLDPKHVDLLLPLIAQAERSDIRKLLSYPENSAGSIMTTEYASLPQEITVEESLRRLRRIAPDRETIYYVYVLDDQRHLHGFVSLRQLILAKPDAIVADIMDHDVISVNVNDDQEDVASMLGRYDLLAIPVVDDQNCLVGIITHDDVIDVIQEEATEDAHRAGAVEPLEDSYLSTPILTITWKRGIWLLFLFTVAQGISVVVDSYKEISEHVEWMGTFIALVIATGGNAGSQSAALVIRTLALGEAGPSDWLRIAAREATMGLMFAAVLSTLGFFPAWGLQGWDAAIIVSATVAIMVMWGSMIGAMLPIVFKKIGMDPALISNPLVAAIVDFTGILVYYEFAQFWLTPVVETLPH